MDENDFRSTYFQNAFLKFTLISAVFKVLNDYEAHWQRHSKDTLQLKVLQTWINISINSFWNKYDETKVALQIISCTKICASSLKNIAPRHFTYYSTLLFLWNKLSFEIQTIVDRIIFSATCLPFYLLILCVSWSSSCTSQLFYRSQ